MLKFFILLSMIFLHIIDDYYLQGILAQMKQREWWRKHEEYKDLYKYDYIMALLEHAFSNTFMMMLPIMVYIIYTNNTSKITVFIIYFIINILGHATTDNIKCNIKSINLIRDQLIHIAYIILTWLAILV